ncbi:unnamed protein product [Aphanomyces euteiches]
MYAPGSDSALTALEHAVALPDAFSKEEYVRALRRNQHDVTKAALQLKAKHSWLKSNQLDNLGLGKPSLQREVKKQYLQLLHDATDKCKCPVVLFSVAKFHPTQSSDMLIPGREQCTDHGAPTDNTTSNIEDARRLVVYMVTLAIEAMEVEEAPGIVYLIDMEGQHSTKLPLRANNFTGVSTNLITEGSVHLEFLRMLKEHFPETVQFCFVLNYSASVWVQQATTYLLKTLGVSERTQQKIKFVKDLRELQHYFNAPALPEKFGGLYKLMRAQQWMEIQAEIEEVDLENLPAEEETTYMTKQARELNGMQYAACSVNEVVEMNTTVLRGAVWRNKSGMSWVKMYAVLRPDALLLYEDIKGKMPMVIIPVTYQSAIVAADFDNAPKGTFGFRFDVEGVPGGHLLAANSEIERGNWLQDIQMAIQSFQEQHAREVYEEERKFRMDQEFEKLNMIDFSTELPAVPPPKSPPAPAPIPTAIHGAFAPPQPSIPTNAPPVQPFMMNPMQNMTNPQSMTMGMPQMPLQYPQGMPMQQPMGSNPYMAAPMQPGMYPQQQQPQFPRPMYPPNPGMQQPYPPNSRTF